MNRREAIKAAVLGAGSAALAAGGLKETVEHRGRAENVLFIEVRLNPDVDPSAVDVRSFEQTMEKAMGRPVPCVISQGGQIVVHSVGGNLAERIELLEKTLDSNGIYL